MQQSTIIFFLFTLVLVSAEDLDSIIRDIYGDQYPGLSTEPDPRETVTTEESIGQGTEADIIEAGSRRKRDAKTGSMCTYWGRPGVCTRYYLNGYKCRRGKEDDPEKRLTDIVCTSPFDACCSQEELQRIHAEELTSTTFNYEDERQT